MKIKYFKIFLTMVTAAFVFTYNINAFADNTKNEYNDKNSYEQYFSEEHIYKSSRISTEKEYFYRVVDGTLLKSTEPSYNEMTADKAFVLFDRCFVNDFAINNNEIFIISNNKIIKIDLEGENESIVLELRLMEDEMISDIFVTDELIWFRLKNSVFRLHRDSNTLDKIYSNDDLAWYKPISNYSIKCDIYTEEMKLYIENGGSINDDFYFVPTVTYLYNSQTKVLLKADEIVNNENTISTFALKATNGSDYSSYKTSIKGVDIPLSNYPIGIYLNQSRTSPCSHHSTKNVDACSTTGSCGCTYLGSSTLGYGIQCLGFAKKVYGDIYGAKKGESLSFSSVNSLERAESIFSDLHPGAYIRADGKHSLIFLQNTNDGADFYHANFRKPCRVDVTNFTYSEIAEMYSNLSIVDGFHVYHIEGNYQVCQYCGYKIGIYSA